MVSDFCVTPQRKQHACKLHVSSSALHQLVNAFNSEQTTNKTEPKPKDVRFVFVLGRCGGGICLEFSVAISVVCFWLILGVFYRVLVYHVCVCVVFTALQFTVVCEVKVVCKWSEQIIFIVNYQYHKCTVNSISLFSIPPFNQPINHKFLNILNIRLPRSLISLPQPLNNHTQTLTAN